MARAMKDSGVEWIGEIPEGWGISRVGRHFCIILGKMLTPKQQDPSYTSEPYFCAANVHFEKIETDNIKQMWFSPAEKEQYLVHNGDALLVEGGNAGCCQIVKNLKFDTYIQNSIMIIRGNDECDNSYFRYLMEYLVKSGYIEASCNRATIVHFTKDKVSQTPYCVPPEDELHRIADFLDTQTAEIDASIAKTQESIEEYKKLKQAVITQAVTKGIRPGRVMKDSGAEWWPVVSEACKITHLGRVCTVTLGKMLTPEPKGTSDTLERYFCAANVHFGSVDEGPGLKRMWFSPKEKADYAVAEGDMLVVEGGAGAGGAAIVKRLDSPTYIQNSIMIVRGGALCDNRYVCYALESLVKRGYIDIACNKATIPHFTKDKLSTTSIPYRDIAEQQEIAAYLDEKCAAIDTLIEKKQAIITELEAYKKSLIYEYVTGKKEVTV